MLSVRRGTTRETDIERAADELADAIRPVEPGEVPALGIVFVSPGFDFSGLALQLAARLPFPLIGCTTAGQVTREHGYSRGSVEAVSLAAPGLRVATELIEDLGGFCSERALETANRLFGRLGLDSPRLGYSFAFALFDGLSLAEERAVGELYAALRGLPIIGGSAGDDLAFERTWVMVDGRTASNAAAICIAEVPVPVRDFHEQHFAPTARRMVITGADTARRVVTHIDGKPALVAYAQALGMAPEAITPSVYSANPVTVTLDGEPWVRAIQRVDGNSLVFFCAIAEGMVLRLARGEGQVQRLASLLERLDESVGGASLVLGCDCILRRLELEGSGQLEAASRVLERVPFFGFSTYGEQRGAVHVNQTLTGLVFGGGRQGAKSCP